MSNVDFSRTLLSHEWLAPLGGSENVFEQMALAMPGSTLHCLWNDAPDRFSSNIGETFLARTPLRRSKALALPLMPFAWQAQDLRRFDRVVASSHAFCHHLASRAARRGTPAFAYVYTPARYVWHPELDERGAGVLARCLSRSLRGWDRKAISSQVHYATISRFVQERIRSDWQVDSTVIYPPVAVERIQSVTDWAHILSDGERTLLDQLPDQFVLGASRFVKYKRLDLTVRIGELLGLPVVLAGHGPMEASLRDLASSAQVPVNFVGRVSDQLLFALYQRASLFVFMAVEDFGIVPVEAMAAGTPVLVNSIGGTTESVTLASGGETVDARSGVSELKRAAVRAMAVDREAMMASTAVFGEVAFRSAFAAWVSEHE